MSQKTHIAASLGQQSRRRALDHIHNTGKHLPATVKKVKGSIIQVEFNVDGGYTLPSITIPHFGPEYTRYPTQKGDKGVVIAVDAAIGHVSALGPKKAPGISRPGNLSPLIFLPIASQDWSAVDGDKINHYGKTGAVSSDQGYESVQITHYKDQQGSGNKGFAGWARGKPQNNFDPANIDPTKFDHFSVGNDDGITHGTKGDHNVNASGDNSNSNVTAKKSHNVNAESTNLKGADGSSDTTFNVQGTSNTSKDHNVGQTLTAALGAFGGIGGSGGGAGSQIPGDLSMGGNVAAAGQLSGASLSVSGALQYALQYLQPTTGSTVSLLLLKPFTFINPAGSLAALTLSFPGSPQDGDVIAASFTRAVTTLSFSGGSFGPNNPTSIPAAGAQLRWMFVAAAGLWLLF